MPGNTEPAEVIQADRDAAAAFIRSDGCPLGIKFMMGGVPYKALCEAFARHRQSHTAAAVAAEREWLPIETAPKDEWLLVTDGCAFWLGYQTETVWETSGGGAIWSRDLTHYQHLSAPPKRQP